MKITICTNDFLFLFPYFFSPFTRMYIFRNFFLEEESSYDTVIPLHNDSVRFQCGCASLLAKPILHYVDMLELSIRRLICRLKNFMFEKTRIQRGTVLNDTRLFCVCSLSMTGYWG